MFKGAVGRLGIAIKASLNSYGCCCWSDMFMVYMRSTNELCILLGCSFIFDFVIYGCLPKYIGFSSSLSVLR